MPHSDTRAPSIDTSMYALTEGSSISLMVFAAVCVFVGVAIPYQVIAVQPVALRARRMRRTLVIFVTYVGAVSLIPLSGILEKQSLPPPVLVFFVACVGFAVAFGLSQPFKQVAEKSSVSALLLFHVFRIPLELVLSMWSETSTVPPQITWHGYNFDIVTGLLALVLGLAALRHALPHWLLLGFNLLGLAMLINIAVVAATSAPTPFRQFSGVPLTLPFHLPYSYIATICVCGAVLAHTVFLRKLLAKSTNY